MNQLIGNELPSPEALEAMRRHGGKWAAYQNHAMDSATFGALQFLKIGPECTFKQPPDRMPDTPSSIGWRYLFVGWVDLEVGDIKPEAASSALSTEGG